jgi:hypothetical protein
VQSLIAIQPVTTSADNQAIKEDAQQIAARIAARLRQAGYLCTVLESPPSQAPACNRNSNRAVDVGCHASPRGVRASRSFNWEAMELK